MSDRIRELMAEGHTKIEKRPEEPSVPAKDITPKKAETVKDDFIAKDISPRMKENLQMVLKSDITPEELRVLRHFAGKRYEILTSIEKIGPEGMMAISHIADDDEHIRAGKLRLISLINELSGRETFRKVIRIFGKITLNMRKIKELLS